MSCSRTSDALPGLESIEHLRSFTLKGVKVDLDEVCRLPVATPLESLDLSDCDGISSKWKTKAISAGLLRASGGDA